MSTCTRVALAMVGALWLVEQAAPASPVVLDATDAGFVTAAGGSAKGDSMLAPPARYNYSVGRELHYSTGALGAPLAPMDRKNYFVFDLTGVDGPILAASLNLNAGLYESLHPTEFYELRVVPDQAGALADADALAAGAAIADFDSPADPLVGMAAAFYTKIPVGPPGPPIIGGIVLSAADDFDTISIPFGPVGLLFLNTHLGTRIILGGIVPTALPPDTPQQPFGLTGPDIDGGVDPLIPELVLTVPEPASLALLAVATTLVVSRRGVAGCKCGIPRSG